MKHHYLLERLLGYLLGVILPFNSGIAKATTYEATNEAVNVETTVFLSGPLTGKDDDSLPVTLRELALPISDSKLCEGLIIIPEIQVVRADLEKSITKKLLEPLEQSWDEKIAGIFRKNPDVSAWKKKIENALDSSRVDNEWLQTGDKDVTLDDLINESGVTESTFRFILPAKKGKLSEEYIGKIAANDNTFLLENANEWPQRLLEKLCTGSTEQNIRNAKNSTIAFIYKPIEDIVDPPVCTKDGNCPTDPPTRYCDQNILLQGIQFVSMAKAKTNAVMIRSDLENAFRLFDSAVTEANKNGGCCGNALMNRGIARDLLGESNLALDDLKDALRCDSNNDSVNKQIHYNMACSYSKHHTKARRQLDLALQAMEKAIKAGFKDCDQIKRDPDLANLRNDTDQNFGEKLRIMLHQHGQYCI